jgi:hypothetical protein
MRMNIGTSRQLVKLALTNIAEALNRPMSSLLYLRPVCRGLTAALPRLFIPPHFAPQIGTSLHLCGSSSPAPITTAGTESHAD